MDCSLKSLSIVNNFVNSDFFWNGNFFCSENDDSWPAIPKILIINKKLKKSSHWIQVRQLICDLLIALFGRLLILVALMPAAGPVKLIERLSPKFFIQNLPASFFQLKQQFSPNDWSNWNKLIIKKKKLLQSEYTNPLCSRVQLEINTFPVQLLKSRC